MATLYENNLGSIVHSIHLSSPYDIAYHGSKTAQVFTIATAHNITSVVLKLYKSEFAEGTVTVSIKGFIDGSDLCSTTVDLYDITNDVDYEFVFNPGAVLSANDYYYIHVEPEYQGGVYIRCTHDDYAEGLPYRYRPGVAWIEQSDIDFYFAEYGDPVGVSVSGIITAISSVTGTIYGPAKVVNPTPGDEFDAMTLDWMKFEWESGDTNPPDEECYDVYAGTNPSSLVKIASQSSGLNIAQNYLLTVMSLVYPYTGTGVYGYNYYWRVDTIWPESELSTQGDTWGFTTISFASPKPSGATTWNETTGKWGGTLTGGNNMITVKRFVGVANNRIWYEVL